jgi:hypothetical protein
MRSGVPTMMVDGPGSAEPVAFVAASRPVAIRAWAGAGHGQRRRGRRSVGRLASVLHERKLPGAQHDPRAGVQALSVRLPPCPVDRIAAISTWH